MKVVMLGTGMGTVMDLYNTCFVMQNDRGAFLIDAGGSIEIKKRLKKANIKLEDLENVFISHSHADHILGLVWLLKGMAGVIMKSTHKNKMNIYCNDKVYEAIKGIFSYTLPQNLLEKIYDYVNFIILDNGSCYDINGVYYEFFDICAKGSKQYGFSCMLDKKKFVFLGDEPLNSLLKEKVRDADYVMHEAFCLDKEKDIFHPYEKNHSTALSTAKVMSELNVKNLILYHTEESHRDKSELYKEEAANEFLGNIIVPNDMEVIELV